MLKSSRFYIRGNTNLKIVIMKKLKNLKGAKELSKKEQQQIKGGNGGPNEPCIFGRICKYPLICVRGICIA
jgi:hypothetical protein